MLRSKSRSGYLEIGQKKHSSLFRSISRSKFCRGDGLASQVDKEALVSVDRNSSSLSENRIVKAAMMQKQISNLEEELKNTKVRLDEAETERIRVIGELREVKERAFSELKTLEDSLSNYRKKIESRDSEISLLSNQLESAKVFEVKLGERDNSIQELKKRILELEDQVEKTKKSESNTLESLKLQTQQSKQTKIELEESKLEVVTLKEKLKNSDHRDNLNSCLEAKTLKDEIKMLKNEVKLAIEAEEKSKKAMDDLALALKEVATEANATKEKIKLSEEQVTYLKDEIKKLNKQLELQTNTTDRLRVEAEESFLAWTAKEMSFISCLRKADEENASLKRANNNLNAALTAAENTTRIKSEEVFKLRDILNQALNESSCVKESSNKAQHENSEFKDLLAEEEECLQFLTKENERSRINEVADCENVEEIIKSEAAIVEANKPCDDQEQMVNKDDVIIFDKEDNQTEVVADDNPEKAETLNVSIFEANASPISEPQTPKTKAQRLMDATGYADFDGSGQFEEMDNNINGRSNGDHIEDSEDKGFYMYGLYDRKKLFKKIGELIVGIKNSKEEGILIDQDKEQGKEHQQSKQQVS